MKKWIWIAVSILVVGIIGVQLYSSTTKTSAATVKERTAEVKKGKLEVKLSGSGTVQPVVSKDVESTSNNDEIDEVLASIGEEVNEGDELVTFTDGSDPIVSPAKGVVTSISVASGDKVNTGQVVAHVSDYSDLQTVVQIDELDISKVKVGQSVSLKVNAFADQTYSGTVSKVSEEGTSSNGVSTFEVYIHIDKIDHLKVGMGTEASILTDTKENALYVPLDAVHLSKGKKYVDLSGASSEKIEIKTGLANEDYVEITEGLSEGQIVKLPQLAASNAASTTNSNNNSLGGLGGLGGMTRSMGRN
ncbi:HlyD family efflux transporter periplasmic adaptor subunit [Neobacillus sp. LXY-1]|uniref:HlyD family efflux transporter periplasmic adaptor subunit n=1 Tax=Neobacillus sp. LXY-1 TaxID=3379133 RepID=UPI003EE130F6